MTPAQNTPERVGERSAMVLVLAVLVGVPLGRNYYRNVALDPHVISANNPNRTMGLGSGACGKEEVRLCGSDAESPLTPAFAGQSDYAKAGALAALPTRLPL